MTTRKKWTIAIAAVLLVSVAIALLLWRRSVESGPALLRVLPAGADLYALANLESFQANPAVRRFLEDPPGVGVSEDYRRFVEASGFRYQDDLRQLALAKLGSNYLGAVRIAANRERMLEYLSTARTANPEESANPAKTEVLGVTVFTFGQERPFRLALPEPDLAVFTIGDDNSLIENMLIRQASSSADGSGASDLASSGDLPRFTKGDAFALVLRTERLQNQELPQTDSGPFRFGGPLLRGSRALYVTVRSNLTQLDFEVENRCEDPAAAERFARMMQSLLVLLRASPIDQSEGAEQKLSVLLRDISVQQVSDSVLLTWQWDAGTLRRLE